MPIYMDLHMVPGVKAKGVAEAHQLDVKIEEEFSCKCMTYWVDEARGHVFCLIDAPCREAVIEMHSKAHGLVPHRIIEVQASVVESFLGRVSDPEEITVGDEGLTVFHDPSFRILLLTELQDVSLLKHRFGHEKTTLLLHQYQQIVRKSLAGTGGKETEWKGTGFLASFTSAANAVACALEIHRQYVTEEAGLRIGICAGEPVAKNENLFGDTIQMAEWLCFIAQKSQPVLTSAVNELLARKLWQRGAETLLTLTPRDENFLYALFSRLEEKWNETDFMQEDYCRSLAMSQSQFYRKTVALTGHSPNTLLRKFRLEKAKAMLRTKQYSVSEISFANGFTSPSYFTKCFKNRYGLLPLAYVDLVA